MGWRYHPSAVVGIHPSPTEISLVHRRKKSKCRRRMMASSEKVFSASLISSESTGHDVGVVRARVCVRICAFVHACGPLIICAVDVLPCFSVFILVGAPAGFTRYTRSHRAPVLFSPPFFCGTCLVFSREKGCSTVPESSVLTSFFSRPK